MSALSVSINKALQTAPKPVGVELPYGTAGFRCDASKLPHAMVRCGLLAVLKSRCMGGLPIGVCVTASHNPVNDNGVKIVEPDGGMLTPEFEEHARELINSDTPFATLDALVQKCCKSGKPLQALSEDYFKRCRVVVACDTRPSSPTLVELVKLGVTALNAQLIDVGVATTPMLHWTVATRHQDTLAPERSPTEFHQAYYAYWVEKARAFAAHCEANCQTPMALIADCACGVGGPSQLAMRDAFAAFNCQVSVRNTEPTESCGLNDCCGAEYVQKGRKLPRNFGQQAGDVAGTDCFSLDGDADRVVFFSIPESESGAMKTLVDGDRIAAVLTAALLKMIEGVCRVGGKSSARRLRVGVVQTAYANGGSTAYLRSMAAPASVQKEVAIAKTGVKNVHHEAIKHDIGVYFESNGHGTVTYKLAEVKAWAVGLKDESVLASAEFQTLQHFLELIDEYVGDAIVDALALVGAMRYLGLRNLADVLALYPDLAVAQSKVMMPRAVLNTLKSHPVHELHLVEPAAVQHQIDALVANAGDRARAFVRASGTEDACRIYAEAADESTAHQLAAGLQQLLATLI